MTPNPIPSIPSGLLTQLVQCIGVHHIPAQTVLIDFHSYIRQIPILLKGSIQVFTQDESGVQTTLYFIRPGESCVASILSALSHSESLIQAVAIEDCELVLLSPDKVRELVYAEPFWFDYIMSLYKLRFEELLGAVHRVGFDNMEERIMYVLETKKTLTKSKIIEITHRELANELGSSREVVSRLLKKLEKKGIVKTGKGRIWVV